MPSKNPWILHMAATRKKHPGASFKEIAGFAKKSYKPVTGKASHSRRKSKGKKSKGKKSRGKKGGRRTRGRGRGRQHGGGEDDEDTTTTSDDTTTDTTDNTSDDTTTSTTNDTTNGDGFKGILDKLTGGRRRRSRRNRGKSSH